MIFLHIKQQTNARVSISGIRLNNPISWASWEENVLSSGKKNPLLSWNLYFNLNNRKAIYATKSVGLGRSQTKDLGEAPPLKGNRIHSREIGHRCHCSLHGYSFLKKKKRLLWVSEWASLSRVRLLATLWTICSLPGSSVHGILQTRILKWVAISFSRGCSEVE